MPVLDLEQAANRAGRVLAGATILQAVPAMNDDRTGRAALDLALALLRSGARALVAGGGGRLVGELQAVGGEWMEFGFESARASKRRRNTQALQELLATERVELVHAHGADMARNALPAAKAAAVPLVAAYHGVPAQRAASRFRADPLSQADAVLAPSQFVADLIAKQHSIPPERIGVVPHSIDTAWFDPAAVRSDRVAALRHAWRIAAGERVVLAPGKSGSANAQLTLVDAARILVNGGLRDVTFVVTGEPAGSEDQANALESRIGAQGLAAIFRTVGPCADMPAAYAAADLVVLPAERTGALEETAAEALSMARPVIAAGIGALPEIVLAPPRVPSAQRTGWLTRPRDPLDLARALAAAVATEADAWEALGARARQLAERRFSPARITQATLAVYGALLEGS